MKAIFLVLITSIFASEFTDIEDLDTKVKWSVGITFGNIDMFAPEFDHIDDEFKIKIKDIIKTILPVVVPHIPTVGPIIAPFLSEEDMEPEVIDYDKDELADYVLAVLAEDYEMDAGFWKSVKKFVKKIAPIVIKKVVPMIPKVGPIVAPFLGEEDSDEMVANMTNPFAKSLRPRLHSKLRPHARKFKKPIKRTAKPTVEPKLDEIQLGMEELIVEEGHELDEGSYEQYPGSRMTPKYVCYLACTQGMFGAARKTACGCPSKVPVIPKVGPVVAPFLGEEDNEVDSAASPPVVNGTCPEGYKVETGIRAYIIGSGRRRTAMRPGSPGSAMRPYITCVPV